MRMTAVWFQMSSFLFPGSEFEDRGPGPWRSGLFVGGDSGDPGSTLLLYSGPWCDNSEVGHWESVSWSPSLGDSLKYLC